MSEEKVKRHGPIRTAKNLWYMLRFSFKYTPTYTLVTLGEAFGRGTYHIIDVFFVKYLFDAIEAGVDFKELLFWVILATLYKVLFELFNKWRLEVYCPKVRLTLHQCIQNELYKKARALDQSCYDDPEFYNDFIWAIRESDGRVGLIMENFGIFFNRILTSVVTLGLLATMDYVIAGVLLVSVTLGFLVKGKLNRINYERNLEMNPISRKLGYIGRVFYLWNYAKEMRQGGIAEHLSNEYEKTTEVRLDCIKKYMWKTFWFSLLAAMLTNFMPQAGVTGYLIVRYLLDPTLSLGGFSASITASFKLFWTIDDIGNYLNKFNEHSLYIEKVRRFIDYEPKVKGECKEVPPFESLTVRGLDFSYPFSNGGKKTLE
ncbi:MAG: ABC transporter ATP-binding protein, partial [Clostridia bacterium]|nr:ABC transporter ATP-binding protein [Clostridia bacterium]